MKRMSKHERFFFFCFYSWRLQARKTLVRPVGEKTNKQTSREDGWGGEHSITFFFKGGGLMSFAYMSFLKGLLDCRCVASVSCNIWKSRDLSLIHI